MTFVRGWSGQVLRQEGMAMPIHTHGSGFRFGPFRVHVHPGGGRTVILKIGPVHWRLWGGHERAGLARVDLPGPFSYYRQPRPRR